MPITPAGQRQVPIDAGTSLLFTAVNTQKAYETAENSAYRTGPISVFAWFFRYRVLGAFPQTIVGKGKETAHNLAWILYIKGGTVNVDLSTDGTAVTTFSSTLTINNADWHHVGFTYDPVSTTLIIYIDGVADSTFTNALATIFASTMPVTVGATSNAIGSVVYIGSGRIQEVLVTTQILSLAQVKTVYRLGAVAGTPAGATTSIWIIGSDLATNSTSAIDYGNANSPLTLSGVNVDGYGRTRPRITYSGLSTKPYLQNIVAGVGFTDPANGWNGYAQGYDIAQVQPAAQSAIASMLRGVLCYAYATYDFAGNSGSPGDGSSPDIKSDLIAGVPQGLLNGAGVPVTIIGYDNEPGFSPVAEQNNVSLFQTAARDVHNRGFLFMAIPAITYQGVAPNASGIAAITSGSGTFICDYYVVQAQKNMYTVDTFVTTMFPIINSIALANPNCKIIVEGQFSSVNQIGRVTDQLDIAQALHNADGYIRSLGSQLGLGGWAWGGNRAMSVVARSAIRPPASRSLAARVNLRT